MCKHVSSTESKKAEKVLELSEKLGYPYCKWGSHSGNTDIKHHLNLIKKQEEENYFHALRVVIIKYKDIGTSKKYIWADNLHSTIRYIRLYGTSVTLKDIPCYIIELSDNEIKVYNKDGSLHEWMI